MTIVEDALHMLIQWLPVNPFHFQDGIPLPVDSNPLRLKRERDFIRRLAALEVTTDGFIARLLILILTQKASDGPCSPMALYLIDTGKPSGDRQWKA